MTDSRRHILVIILFLFIAGAVFPSCSRLMPERDPYTIYTHLRAEPGTLNPYTATDAYSSAINQYIYESLLDRDYDTLELIPQLAEKWRVSPDKMRYRFYLKKGIYWSDGIELTADDVVYSFVTMKDPKVADAHLKVYYIDVKGVKKIDKYTVEFSYSKISYMALSNCGGLPIIPKHVFNDGTDFNSHKNNRKPIGTGPYQFDKWETGKNITLVHNPRFRDKKPEIKKLVFKIVQDQSVALQMLKKGDLDEMELREIEWVRQTNSEKFQDHFYKLKYYLPIYAYIGWNSGSVFFKDRRVRLAMTELINRQAILDKLRFGIGEIVAGPFFLFGQYYDRDLKPWPHDPANALRLLREAGWADHDGDGILDKDGKKFSFTFTIPSESKFGERLGSIMKEDFAKIGIEMDIARFEWAVFLSKIQSRNFDATTLRWSGGYDEDPYQIWHSSQIKGGSNYVGFNNKEADRLIEEARQEFDAKKRIKLYRRFQEILHYYQPYTFLYATPNLVVISKRFLNVKEHKRGLNLLEWKVRPAQ